MHNMETTEEYFIIIDELEGPILEAADRFSDNQRIARFYFFEEASIHAQTLTINNRRRYDVLRLTAAYKMPIEASALKIIKASNGGSVI